MNNNSDYFGREEESKGKAVLLMLVFGLAAAIVGSIAYAAAVYYIPSSYFKILMVVLFGALLGKVIIKAASLAKCENRSLIVGITILLVIFAEYFNWVSTLYIYKEIHVLRFGLQDIFSWMKLIAASGFWEWNSILIKGGMAWLLWGLEFIGILGAAISVVWKEMDVIEGTKRFVERAVRMQKEQQARNTEYNNEDLQYNSFNENKSQNENINNNSNDNSNSTQYYGQPDNEKLESYMKSLNNDIDVSNEKDTTF